MRIISGRFKSRLLTSFKHSPQLRPTSDKVKEAIFDIIGDNIINSIFLDLFAGTGQIGIEALSRGSQKTFFVEKNFYNSQIIEKNLGLLDISSNSYEIYIQDAFKFLKNFNKSIYFNIIFIDPPYNKGLTTKIIKSLKTFSGITKDTLMILEHSNKEQILFNEVFDIIKQKSYGDTNITFLRKK